MDNSFGYILLSVNGIIEGKSLSYGFSNRPMPEKFRALQAEFRFRFSRWLTEMSYYMDDSSACRNIAIDDFNFLQLCVDNIENISKNNLDWYTPDKEVVNG